MWSKAPLSKESSIMPSAAGKPLAKQQSLTSARLQSIATPQPPQSTPALRPSPEKSPPREVSKTSKSRLIVNWIVAVFFRRKPYIPGDSCRYIWQKSLDIDGKYVIYRAVFTFCQSSCLFISFFHLMSPCPSTENAATLWACLSPWMGLAVPWPFFLTTWGIILNFAQSVIALVIIIRVYRRQTRGVDNPYGRKSEHSLLTLSGLNAALHTFALIIATIISLMYWAFIAGREGHSTINLPTVAEHCFNFVFVAIDHAIVAFPVMPIHGIVIVVFAASYSLVNFTYYAAGGTDNRNERRYLYSFLNWERSRASVAMALAMTFFAFVLLLILLLIDYFKFKWRPSLKEPVSRVASEQKLGR